MNQPVTIETLATGNSSQLARLANLAARNLHWVVTALLIICLYPAFRVARMPFYIAWFTFLDAYWVGLASRSIFVAILFYLLVSPLRENLHSVYGHYKAQPIRLVFLAFFTAAMIWENGWGLGLMLAVDLIAIAELFDRTGQVPDKLGHKMRAVFGPAVYLFVGLVLVMCYNDVVASLKNPEGYSQVFNKFDSILLGGWTVSEIAHAVMPHFPPAAYGILELTYFGMFGQIGSALIFNGFASGGKRAFAYVGAILTAYYLSLAVYFLWPSMSPFSTCPDHFLRFPPSAELYNIQKVTMLKARLFWSHKVRLEVNTDYYIAFPCMHIALPLIVLWFMQQWRRIAIILIAYDVILAAAILLLEQHYLVDVLGGVLVAALAIYMVDSSSRTSSLE